MYDYREAMRDDIKRAIEDNKDFWNWDEMDIDEKRECLNEQLWCDDSVTGNGSGSYTFNAAEALENIKGNEDLITEAVDEFCIDAKTVAEHLTDWEYWDVTIRCSLLWQMIDEVLDEMEEETEEEEEIEEE